MQSTRSKLRLNNGVELPALGFAVFQTPPVDGPWHHSSGAATRRGDDRERSVMKALVSNQKVTTLSEGMRLHAHPESRNPRPRRRR